VTLKSGLDICGKLPHTFTEPNSMVSPIINSDSTFHGVEIFSICQSKWKIQFRERWTHKKKIVNAFNKWVPPSLIIVYFFQDFLCLYLFKWRKWREL